MLIVVAGQSSSVGKTSVVAELIAALRHMEWNALKISPCVPAQALPQGEFFVFRQELVANSRTDAGRYLAAGAKRAYTLLTCPDNLKETEPVVERVLNAGDHVIVESQAALTGVRPDLMIGVINLCNNNTSEAAIAHLRKASAYLMIGDGQGRPRFPFCDEYWFQQKPVFRMDCEGSIPTGLVELVKVRAMTDEQLRRRRRVVLVHAPAYSMA